MPKAQPLLLDLYPNASVAYSLRKLRTAYSGNCIRVRRSSDNTEQNIGFVGNELDTASLLTFCGAGNGFVTTWYDHSGIGRNGIQTTAANQAQIVSNGSLIIDPDNGRLSTLWTNDRYGTGFYSLNANNLVSSVYVGNRVSGNIISFGSSNNQQANSFRWLSNNNLSSFGTATNGTSSLTGDFIAFTQRLGNSDVNMWINNVQQTSGISTINTGPNFFGNSDNTIFNNGYFQEGILWNGNDQSSNRTAIETNINNYYGIY